MSELKERIKGRLGDLLPLKYGKSLPAAVRDNTGSVPVYGSSGVVGNHSAALTSGPAIIVGRKGNVGAVHYSAVPCWPIDTSYFAEAPIGHDPRYYRYLLSSLGLARLDKSTAIPGLSRDDYNAVEVTIHPPEQQAEVVAEIEKQFSRLDEAVANLQRVKANLKRYKASVLKAAVEGRLVETEASIAQREGRSYETGEQLLQRILEERRAKWVGKSKYKEPVEQTTAFTGAVPAGWTSATVDQLGSVQLGKMLDKQKHTAGAPYQYLRNINVRWGAFDVSDVFEMNFETDELERFSVRSGDVLVCEGGEPARAAVWRSNQTDMKYQKALHRVRFDGAYLPDLLVIALEHLAKSGVLDELYGGSTIKHFTRETFVKLVLPVPPTAEQSRIVAEVDRHLSIIHEVESEVDANLQRAQALRQATLRSCFLGRIV